MRAGFWKALRRFWESDRGLSAFLGTLVVFLFVLPPLVVQQGRGRGVLIDLGFTALLLAGVAALSRRPGVRAALFSMVVAATAVRPYELVGLMAPGAFSFADLGGPARPDFAYFSFVTLTTVGYGDVTPVHPVARSLALVEALTGQLYPAILLARLVSLATGSQPSLPPGEPRG
jgi:voltage-gated potassium channel Kch